MARYVKLWVAHAPGMPGTFLPSPQVSNPDIHHGMCATNVPWCALVSLTSSFLLRWCQKKCSRHSRRMLNPQFYVFGKRLIACSSNDIWRIYASYIYIYIIYIIYYICIYLCVTKPTVLGAVELWNYNTVPCDMASSRQPLNDVI